MITVIDIGILTFCLLLAIWGYGQGILVSAFSLGGFFAGAVLGSRLVPAILPEGSESVYAPLFSLVAALALGAIAAAIMESIASAVRSVIARGPLATLDSLGGALLAAALGLGIVWVVGAVVLQTPQLKDARKLAQKSLVLKELNRELPPSGPILRALARIDPFPNINGPSANVGKPSSAIISQPGVKEAGDSVLRVLGTSCGLGVEGSGWVASNDQVVTNAHVVAGESDTVVVLHGGAKLQAKAVAVDSKNDVAVLKIDGLGLRSLQMTGSLEVGASASVLGYPENGPFDAEPARVGQTAVVISSDAYGNGPVQRKITAIRANVRHGNSGGPVVNSNGEVVATVFAASSDGSTGYAVPDSVVESVLKEAGDRQVSTGPCA